MDDLILLNETNMMKYFLQKYIFACKTKLISPIVSMAALSWRSEPYNVCTVDPRLAKLIRSNTSLILQEVRLNDYFYIYSILIRSR